MSSASKISDLEKWLHLNSFWNADILEIKKSEKFNGLGVFQRGDAEDDDRLLLRIPKSNILSVKNSCITNLLEDYIEEQIQHELVKNDRENEDNDEDKDEEDEEEEEVEDRVDLSIELHSLVLCFIYEHSVGPKSPWFEYINSIDLENGDLPLCLWDEEDKKLLQNTECDLLHMLDISELVELYAECIRFARSNSLYISIPSVLNWEGDDFQNELVKSKSQLEKFGRFLQAVLSRSFPIDGYHGLSLVPGADMFNHSDLADVKFVRDEDVCDQCGERDCEHDQDDLQVEEEFEDMDEDDEVDDFDDDEIEEILNNDEDIESEEGEENIEVESASVGKLGKNAEDTEDESMALDKELESSEDEFESETELVSSEDETATETEEVDEDEEEDVVEEITVDYIKIMEKELEEEEKEDEDSEGSDDNESLLEISEDEDENGEENEDADADELGKQLATDQCCDIFLLNAKNGEELYNFYGEFSNPILLQRYGFVEDENISDSCMLTVQMFSYLKKITGRKGTQLDIKLQWYDEMGFELVNDLLKIGLQSHGHESEHDHDHDHDHEGENCGENQCCDSESDSEESEEEEEPISWELSPRVNLEGSPTPQTYALLRLILMPFNLFQAKFLHCQSESKLCRRILKLLLPNSMPILHPRVKREHEQVFKVFNLWCKNRLNRYCDGLSTTDYDRLLQDSSLSGQRRTIFRLLKLEKEILTRGCVFSAKDYDAQYSEE